ncbi:unnamed protein product [Caenorhabditis angaria]|uniref:Seven TM Receptor n=1 Tax=Caenorhabditis angaria TaxID=860376 RepID=A0A9P1ISG6_9PELO|nr:unnamed protein product [Caenorhabditis angaria]
MVHDFDASLTFYSVERPFNCSKEISMLLMLLFTSSYAVTVYLLSIQFIYRYLALFNENVLFLFSGFYNIIWFILGGFVMFLWGFSIYYHGDRNQYSFLYLSKEFSDSYNLTISDIPYFSAIIYERDNSIHWNGVKMMGSLAIIVSILYGIIVFCGIVIQLKIPEQLNTFSEKNRVVQKQLFTVLVAQISVPTLIIFLPVMTMYIIPFLNIKISFPASIIVCLLSVYPAVDSIIVMFILSDYRKAVKKIYYRCTCQRNRIYNISSNGQPT